jgi:hypothetical protein
MIAIPPAATFTTPAAEFSAPATVLAACAHAAKVVTLSAPNNFGKLMRRPRNHAHSNGPPEAQVEALINASC